MEIVGCDTSACLVIRWDILEDRLFMGRIKSGADWANEIDLEELEQFVQHAKDGLFDRILDTIRTEKENRSGTQAQG